MVCRSVREVKLNDTNQMNWRDHIKGKLHQKQLEKFRKVDNLECSIKTSDSYDNKKLQVNELASVFTRIQQHETKVQNIGVKSLESNSPNKLKKDSELKVKNQKSVLVESTIKSIDNSGFTPKDKDALNLDLPTPNIYFQKYFAA